MDKKLNMNQQCGLTAQKAKNILDCIKRGVACRWRDMALVTYSALLKPHLECCTRLWSPYHKKMDLLESRGGHKEYQRAEIYLL